MDSEKSFKVYMSGFKESENPAGEKTLEFESLAAAEEFFWNIIKTPFLRDATHWMAIYQGDEITPKNTIMDFGGFEYITVNKPWMKKPYNKEEMQINNKGNVIKSSAWTKNEYEWAISQEKDKKTKAQLIKNMNEKYSKQIAR